MIKATLSLLLISSTCYSTLFAAPASPKTTASKEAVKETASAVPEDNNFVMFTPPPGWQAFDTSSLSPRLRMMVVGKGQSSVPPSINLAMEPYQGTLKQYLKTIKAINDSQGYEWKDLGTIRTEAGTGSLSQVDTKSEWGDIRQMHTVLLKNGTIYIVTAAAQKDEFATFYKDFFAAMKSFRISKDLFDTVADTKQRAKLKSANELLKSQWKKMLIERQTASKDVPIEIVKEELFRSEEFQNTAWKPFEKSLSEQFRDLGSQWQALVLQQTEDELFTINP